MTLRKWIATSAVLIIAGIIAAVWYIRRDNRDNVILIIVDTLRADHIGCYGNNAIFTPNIDALAADGVRFDCVVSAAPVTAPSVATLLTSTYPAFHRLRDNEFFALNPALTTIASVFQDADYRTAGFVASIVLDHKYGFDQGFDYYDDDMSTEYVLYSDSHEFEREQLQGTQRRADDITKAAIAWIRENGKRKAFFCMVHYFDPHMRYDPPPPYKEQYPLSPYDGEIAFSDAQIGILLDAIERMDLPRKTLVVITADHGEGLGDHGEDSHGHFLYDTTMLVPLIFNCPDEMPSGRVIKEQVRTVDVMPTILDLAGLRVPATVQGMTLSPALVDSGGIADRDAYMETFHTLYSYRWHELVGIRTKKWKYIQAPKPELYDLQTDPSETVSLIQDRSDVAKQYEQKLAAMEDEVSREYEPFAASRAQTGSGVLKKMKALGYVGTTDDKRNDLPEPGGDFPDPKDMVNKLSIQHKAKRFLREAMILSDHGDQDGALRMVAAAEEVAPEYAEVFATKGLLLYKKGQQNEGIEFMEEAVKRAPNSGDVHQTLTNLGAAYLQQGRYKDALEVLERSLALLSEIAGSRDASGQILNQTLSNLGMAYMLLGDCEKAADMLERSIQARYDPLSVFNLCAVYEKCGRIPDAIKELEKLLHDNPDLNSKLAASLAAKITKLRAAQAQED